ncbi:hypothetical protein Trydic_g23124 [Trypoxylus dichotomus]
MDALRSRFKPERPMAFPYTFTAKIVQFPWAFYVKNNWIYKYYFIAIAVCIPIFNSIDNLSNSDANKAKWAAAQLKEMQKEMEHR